MRLVLFVAMLMAGCTSAKLTTETTDPETGEVKRIEARYFDFHPGGAAVQTSATWQDVGRLDVDRDTEESDAIVEAVTEAVRSITLPTR